MTFPTAPDFGVMTEGQPEPSGLARVALTKASKEQEVTDKQDVVVPRQDEVSVYVNQRLDVVIKQEGRQGEDDHLVCIHPRYIPALCRALRIAARDAKQIADEEAGKF